MGQYIVFGTLGLALVLFAWDRIRLGLVALISFKDGDVLLLQGREHLLDDTVSSIGCLPFVQRGLRIGYKKAIPLALGIFVFSIALVVPGLLPVQVAFALAAVGMMLSGVLPVKDMYTSVDWPVIVLLGAMIPVGGALESSGWAARKASAILLPGNSVPAWVLLTVVLVVTMLLSDVINIFPLIIAEIMLMF
jgi:di/tricarboxylate transporter